MPQTILPLELNSTTPWHFDTNIPTDTPIWVLIEDNVCNPLAQPLTARVIYDPDEPLNERVQFIEDLTYLGYGPFLNSEKQTIIAWRELTDARDWYDRFYDGKMKPNTPWHDSNTGIIGGCYFDYTLELGNRDRVDGAFILFEEKESLNAQEPHSLGFSVAPGKDDTSINIFAARENINFKKLAEYILDVGHLAGLSGTRLLGYARFAKPSIPHDIDGGGCLLIDFDKLQVKHTTIDRVGELAEQNKFLFSKRVFTTYK